MLIPTRRWRIAAWGTAALLLLLPLVAMQFTDEVDWDAADFAIAGAMLLVAGGIYELAARMTANKAYRAAIGVALAAAFILVWLSIGVGIIGKDGDPRQPNVFWGARCRNQLRPHRAPPTPWDGTCVVCDGARSGVGRHDRADRRLGSPVERAGRDFDAKWVLRCAVAYIGLAVLESGAGASFRRATL